MKNKYDLPVLRGEENDYGQYDYMINELPHPIAEWCCRWHTSRCDSCGKYRHLYFYQESWFYTLDGGDSIDHSECWICMFKDAIRMRRFKFKKKLKQVAYTMKYAFRSQRGQKIKMYKLMNGIMKEV